jgi:DNA-binding SARP family transcriptional activator/tetratricopeptide (TPR) repeat protein
LTYLALNRGTDTSRESLLGIFWGDADFDHARISLKTALWSIRRCLTTVGALPDEFLVANKSIVRWTSDTAVDALQFSTLAASDDPDADQEALRLYRGDFLEGDYDDWSVTERERLAALYETVLARVARNAKDTDAARRFVARNPYGEDVYATLIEADLSAGRRSSAASWVERCRAALSEIGEQPSAAFERRFGAISHIEVPIIRELTLPFAGRETELATMTAKFADAASGHGSVTLLHGAAGIGKSTFLERAARLASDMDLRVIAVRCNRDGSDTFTPWGEIFSAVTGANIDQFAAVHASALSTAVANEIASHLQQPTAIVVDDAHELAAEALQIFVALARATGSRHALIVALRPEGVAALRSSLADVSPEKLPLGRLDRTDLGWALTQALGREQLGVLDVLYDRTGGHPLFFVGLLNSLVTQGALTRERDGWELTKPIDAALELPDTIKHLLESRLKARGETPHLVACTLALEPAATADDLIAVLGLDEPSVLDALDDLLALGLIAQPRSGSQFAFTHDLIREVASAGLNAGRRVILHRAFAQRLSQETRRETSLRLAQHLSAAGDSLPAARSYLNSAREALQMNAAQDAIERCDAGVAAAKMLERSASYELLIALYETAARAGIAAGNDDDAIAHAREAVRLASAAGNLEESARSELALAVVEGATFRSEDQRSDAASAARKAKVLDNQILQAQALVQGAIAARELGLRDEALISGHAAHRLALDEGHAETAQMALEEVLRTQITWWLFSDAVDTARRGLEGARRVGSIFEASFLQVRGALWYALNRFDEAQSELQEAMRILGEQPWPSLHFDCYYMTSKTAAARQQWDQALDAADRAGALTNVAKMPRRQQALSLLRVDLLLQRDGIGDGGTAHELTSALGDSTVGQGLIGWSDCVELARALDSTNMRISDAGAQLWRALNAVEENADRAPLDANRAFARLASAASATGDAAVANRATERSAHYESHRAAAAARAAS